MQHCCHGGGGGLLCLKQCLGGVLLAEEHPYEYQDPEFPLEHRTPVMFRVITSSVSGFNVMLLLFFLYAVCIWHEGQCVLDMSRCVRRPTLWWSTLVCCCWPSPTQTRSTAGMTEDAASLRQPRITPCSSPVLFLVPRPNTYHSNLQVSWDLNTGACCTVGVGDLTEVRGQTRWARDSRRLLLLSARIFVFVNWSCPCSDQGVCVFVPSVGVCGVPTGSLAWTWWWSGWFLRAAHATSIVWPMKLYTKVSDKHISAHVFGFFWCPVAVGEFVFFFYFCL